MPVLPKPNLSVTSIPLQSTSMEIWGQKYQLKDSNQQPVDEDIDAMYWRVAKALAASELEPDYWANEFHKILTTGATPAGRILSNAGAELYKPATSLINCTVSQIVADSMHGVLHTNMQAGITLKAGCGIGYEWSTLRPKDSFVNGAGAFTSGPLSFMNINDATCFTVSSAGGRRGAQMGTFAVWHPDVIDFIQAKRQDGTLRQFNLSLLIDDEFMLAVKNNTEWKLVFPVMPKEVSLGLLDGYETIWKDLFWEKAYCESEGYTMKDGKILCKVYKTVQAIDIWNIIMQSTYDFAEPGFLLIDRINEYNNNYFCETIRATNPCQPEFATLLTKDGIRTFKDVGIGDEIWSGDRWTKIVNKWSTGVKKVYEYSTTRGRFVGTSNHRVVEKGQKIEVDQAIGIDLSVGPQLNQVKIHPQDVMDGLVIGDGFKHKASNDKIVLCIGENDQDYFESEISSLIGEVSNIRKEFAYTISTTISPDELPRTFERKIPDRFYFGDNNRKASFLRGLYSANGSVVANGSRITLKASSREIVNMASEMLSSLGIPSYITTNKKREVEFQNGTYECKESYDLNITAKRDLFYSEIGFIQDYKMSKIATSESRLKYKTSDIKSKEYLGEFEVFDINVEAEEHTYWTGGCLVSNCGEQPLPPEGSCLLGSINLALFVLNPFAPEASFDWDRYISTIHTFSRMLDNVVELNGLPLEGQRHEIEYKRRHGMGFLGLGSALSPLGIAYGSPESIEFTTRIQKTMAIESYRAGIELAKEKGPAPIFNDTTLVDGVEVDNKVLWAESKFMKQIWELEPQMLIDFLKYGSRYTHATSIAPTGTIALSVNNNVSNGIEPTFAHKYTRNVIKPGKKSKEAVDVYSFEMLLYKHITGEEDVPDWFSTSDNVTPEAHVDIQAAAQKWCDSSISKTINVPTDTPFDKFKDIYMYAYDKGLKGCTTFRFNPEALQGVLVKSGDLAATAYDFKLKDGSTVTVAAGDQVDYNGEVAQASNLFDAIKEGYYGKF